MVPGRVTVGFLHPGHVSTVFMKSWTSMLFEDAAGRQRIVSHQFGEMAKECGSGGIVDGRNALARTLLDESASEWLFMVDSDMGFAPDSLERLIEAAGPKRPVVGGLAFAHKTDGRSSFHGVKYRACPTVYDFIEEADRVGFVPRHGYERDAMVECSATGGAFVLIHRKVLDAVRDKYGDNWFTPITHPKGPTTFSEDLSFCIRVAAVGFPLYVHTGIKTTHHKGGVFLDEEFYDERRAPVPA
jgi:hypothetical protein